MGLGEFIATTNPGGAKNWSPDLNKHFKDRDIYILPDNDDAGRDHCAQVARNLFPLRATSASSVFQAFPTRAMSATGSRPAARPIS